MPAKSNAQQKAAGAALSAKRGDTPKSKLQGASRSMYESMSEDQLEEFAETKRKGLPARKAPAKKTSERKSAPRKSRKTASKKTTSKKTASKRGAKEKSA